ncbi:sterol desaturase/sphingolipid hydroxylase (fatty acid hydroxylase superfamily) [Kitasatospora sp. MAA4]|uniref:sterol desaturase family protein n=1 Tax=Kitasatospora sp. MAA4 TaxID=3035093 RepID=UPI002476A9E5|nr:sterol desaturase family protein [Kitasatospora sp. MAA4]MDH6132692.1 sterol desaturase/sphingolipid hydroxylase (fatty acid hydroxylase superfamily) [Kitasatospora sp. MAA4]
MELDTPARPILTYGTYPLLATATAAVTWAAVTHRLAISRDAALALLTIGTIAIAFTVERVNPLLDRWRMTRDSFVGRDLPFIGLAFVVEQVATMGVSLVAARFVPDGGFGPLAGVPLLVQALVVLLALDLLWYAYHRAAHTVPRLWRAHGVHHSPSQLYVLMHPVFHPIDLLVSRFVISLLVFRFSGATPDAAFLALVVLNLQQTISHINSDLRTGPLNYLLIGAETHRWHHGAGERANYGSALAVWDIAFRTFVYEPTRVPDRLGLDDPASYPDPRRFHATLAWPLRRAGAATPAPGK